LQAAVIGCQVAVNLDAAEPRFRPVSSRQQILGSEHRRQHAQPVVAPAVVSVVRWRVNNWTLPVRLFARLPMPLGNCRRNVLISGAGKRGGLIPRGANEYVVDYPRVARYIPGDGARVSRVEFPWFAPMAAVQACLGERHRTPIAESRLVPSRSGAVTGRLS